MNILKSRDDREPVSFELAEEGKFILSQDSQCSWAKAGETFDYQALRMRIEPWLTALFQSEHLSMLIGSGLTHAVTGIAESDESPNMGAVEFSCFQQQIQEAAKQVAEKAKREEPNFEDQIRVANELLIGLRHYCISPDEVSEVEALQKDITSLAEEISEKIRNFATAILTCERNLLADREKGENAINYLVNFLMSPASRSGTRDRLQIFTTNYDRFIEAGAEVAGLHLIDRFVGNVAPIFRSSRLNLDMHYNPPGIRGEPRYLEGVVRFTKLHGSVDWVYSDRDIRKMGLPFGAEDIDPFLKAPGFYDSKPMNLMIYPNSSKDRETTAYPYVDLFRDFAASICRPNNTLVVYGYSFGDEHINRVIEDMLTIPSTHLVIISWNDPMGRIVKTFKKTARKAQITLLVGENLGDLKTLVDYYLPKPAIDRTTYKMAELLKSRFGMDIDERKDEKDEET